MSSRFRALAAPLLTLAPLVLAACQPVVQALEAVAERNNAQHAQHERRASQPADAAEGMLADGPGSETEAGAGALSPADDEPAVTSDDRSRSVRESGGNQSDPAREGPAIVYADNLPTRTPPAPATPDPFAAAGKPQRLEIPSIQVDAAIESVGLTSQGAMDVPKGWMNAAWYELGVRPGEAGNAVIAGHLDASSGGPAVFWDLHLLQPGDLVHVTYENGLRLSFAVESSQVYEHDADTQVIESIFGPGQTADLNLITCMGSWDYGSATYSERLVVFTRLVEGDGSAQ